VRAFRGAKVPREGMPICAVTMSKNVQSESYKSYVSLCTYGALDASRNMLNIRRKTCGATLTTSGVVGR